MCALYTNCTVMRLCRSPWTVDTFLSHKHSLWAMSESSWLLSLPPELIHAITFPHNTCPATTLALALTSRALYITLFGSLSTPNPYDLAQHRAQAGVSFCCRHSWPRAALLALSLGYGDPSSSSNLALKWACSHNHVGLVTALLTDSRVDPSVDYDFPLRVAAKSGFVDVVIALLADYRTNPTNGDWFSQLGPDSDPFSALEVAVIHNRREIVDLFMADHRVNESDDQFADPNELLPLALENTPPGSGIPPLFLQHPHFDLRRCEDNVFGLAAQYGHAEVVATLLEDPQVDPAERSNYAIGRAAEFGRLDVVRLLLDDPRVDPTPDNNYALRFAAANGHVDVVKVLLADVRIDPAAGENIALRWACQHGRVNVVHLLLDDPRTNPTDASNFAIRMASERGHAGVVRVLLDDPRVDPSDVGNMALRQASKRGHGGVVELLLDDPRVSATCGGVLGACLNAAVKRGDERTVELLSSASEASTQSGA